MGVGGLRLYRILAGAVGLGLVIFGLALVVSFFAYQRPGSTPIVPTGPVGFYFIAFTGCALVGWGGGLLGAARNPSAGRTIGTATALACVMMAVIRMLAWIVGDYYVWLGDLPRIEAGVLLVFALAFVWLRPPEGGSA